MTLSKRQMEISRVLLRVWDPIGIGDDPRAADEYDAYAIRVDEMLSAGTDAAEVAAYLNSVVQDRMGMDAEPSAPRAQEAADEILTKWRT